MLRFHISLVVLGGLLFPVAQDAAASHEIIGAPKCKVCHKAKTGDQWKIWTESAHARAFETLASEESSKIATDLGLGDPQQEVACLKCHTTLASLGGGAVVYEKANYTDSEGVGCEACHGPGSEYKARKIMIDPDAAMAAGLVMDRGAENCTSCHNEESPTFKGFDFEQRWAEIAHPVPTGEKAQPGTATVTETPAGVSDVPDEITFESSIGNVVLKHKLHIEDADIECTECHHQIYAVELDTPHPDYLTSSWINCQSCHAEDLESDPMYYKCSECHHLNPKNIADETLSSKVVIHKSCWSCHQTGTGVEASKGCVECHMKDEK
jgi:hypothetical protein